MNEEAVAVDDPQLHSSRLGRFCSIDQSEVEDSSRGPPSLTHRHHVLARLTGESVPASSTAVRGCMTASRAKRLRIEHLWIPAVATGGNCGESDGGEGP